MNTVHESGAGNWADRNASAWDSPTVVRTQEYPTPFLHWYEKYLLGISAQEFEQQPGKVKHIHVVGCGPGRELPAIRQAYPGANITASDISPNMIEACAKNLKAWGCPDGVNLLCRSAALLSPQDGPAQLVIAFNNVLTYVVSKEEQLRTARAFRSILVPKGLLIGVVHHRWGRPGKSAFFALQGILSRARLGKKTVGDHVVSYADQPILSHYYTKGELTDLLSEASIRPRHVHSLASLSRSLATKTYNPLRGDNNLVFVGEAV